MLYTPQKFLTLGILLMTVILFAVKGLFFISYQNVMSAAAKNKETKDADNQYNMAERVKMKCKQLEISHHKNVQKLSSYQLKWLFFNIKARKTFCLQPKSASSSFRMTLQRAYNQYDDMFRKPDGETPYKDGKVYQGSVFSTTYLASSLMLHQFDTFAIVRNPFTRLLSAYKFRILPHNQGIIENQTLPYDVHDAVPHQVATLAMTHDALFWKRGVTFESFLKYVVWEHRSNKKVNLLWIPFEEFCLPCTISYDYIGRFEDMEHTVIRFLKFIYGSHFPQQSKDEFPHFNSNKVNTSSVLQKYYSDINASVIRDILDTFHFDFELLGYDRTLSNVLMT